ncbi:hypothetical protein JD844_001616 [Phrynosoma platyrhinos]|uniref:Ig-like domain-containing protein n=1 Tax=Phrynosoma platyrhinos TaxID=52577 RepID=A0ABQ7TBP2_PHRPL|nr:hypothetical protein JD844_001616 [Phrynosoma platyrhinos]
MKPKAAFLWPSFLLCLRTATSAVLRVTVSPSVIHANPGSAVMLPCHISGTPKPIDLENLAVKWLKGSNVIATYEDKFETNRPGAQMATEKLVQEGDATLLLPRVQDTDDGVYTCSVIYVPDTAEGKVELKVEVPPQLTHGPTKLQLGKPSSVTCLASGFYPGNISVTWLQDGKIVKGPEQAIAHLTSEGLFNAESVLELIPQIVDDNATISCQINHKAIKAPLREDFQLQVQGM